MFTKIVNAGIVVCCDAANTILYDQSIVIKDGLIASICERDKNHDIEGEVIDATKHIVIPGLVNAHTHIPMSYFRGLADDLPLEVWLSKYIWPREAQYISPDFIYQASLHWIGECIKNGITCINDMYFIPSQTVRACRESGIRAVIGDVLLDFPMGESHKPQDNLKFIEALIESVADTSLIDISIAPHSVYACGTDSWKQAILAARKYGLLLQTHLCESAKEVAEFQQSPVKYLYELGAFESKFVMAHGVHLDESDFALLEDKDVSVAINLHSNLKLASGIPPIKEYLQRGINVAFGTDGVASNNRLSIIDEISTAAKLYKAIYKDPTFLPAKEILKMATIGGAKAIGKDHIIGSIEVGKAADMVTIDIDNFQSQPMYDPYSHIIYGMNSQNIKNVIVNGNLLMADGNLVTLDERRILTQCRYLT